MDQQSNIPPRLARRMLLSFLRPELVEEVTGDLDEKFQELARKRSVRAARLNYWYQVLHYLRPFAIRKTQNLYLNQVDMFENYFKVSWRNLHKNMGYSFINVGGLAIGMTVAILIGLWVYDELTYDQYHKEYKKVARVLQNQTFNGKRGTQYAIPLPLAPELEKNFGDDCKYIVSSSWTGDHILSHGETKISKTGNFMDVDAPHLMALKMIRGTANGFKEPGSIMLSRSTALALFGDKDPVNELMRIDNSLDVKVSGVYEDFPYNSSFQEIFFIGPWDPYINANPWMKRARDEQQWGNNSWQLFVQIADNSNMKAVSDKIKNVKYDRLSEQDKQFKAEMFLHPMKDWHLRSKWEDGLPTGGGLIEYVWLFGTVGVFVLLLACINFMNLSTARSEKRAKEVGIRKSIGSARAQLVTQFLSESLLIVSLAFLLSLIIVILVLPSFNDLSDKKILFPFTNIFFWGFSVAFILFTAFLAGSYPALYLSSFQAVKVLKGTFKAGRFSSVPRQVLVIVQFTVSVVLIIATIIVYSQIQFTKNRPIGYDANQLLMIELKTNDLNGKYDVLRNDFINSGAVDEMSESSSPLTGVYSHNGGFHWEGMAPDVHGEFGTVWITPEFGKAVNWQIIEGRDFSRELASDSLSIVINEAAVRFMNIKDPVGKTIRWGGDSTATHFTIIGVVKDLLMESPFEPVKQTVFMLSDDTNLGWMELRLNGGKSAHESIALIEEVFRKHAPDVPFDYKFVNSQHAEKFAAEERVGTLSGIFSGLAVLISCLGLFGLASFVAEKRTKEIGIRKVLGASVTSLLQMLSRDFVLLVSISCVLAIPLAYYGTTEWLSNYEYRTDMHWWFFIVPIFVALLVTLLTVSFQAVRAALMNPVRSLRSE